MKKTVPVIAMFLIVFSSAAQAQQDPFLGTWKENLAKGKYDPGPPPTAPGITKREAMGGGPFKTTTDGVDAQGNKTHTEYTFKLDGKDYGITGSPLYDMQSSRQIDANTRLTVSKKNGAVVRMIRITI